MVNLEWYRSFIAVYQVGTVSGAAQGLHLTQPGVSQQIAALEAALGYPLFIRLPRRMQPTEDGKRLYTEAVGAVERLEAIVTKTTRSATPQILRLGAPHEFFAEQVLERLSKSENWRYRIQLGLATDLITDLLEGRLDAAIATQKVARSDLEYQLIYTEDFWLVGPPNLEIPIASDLLQVDLTQLEKWLKTQPLVAYSEDLPIVRRFWRVVFGHRLDLVPQLVLPDLRLIRQAIASGFGFSVLPNYLCERAIAAGTLRLILQPSQAVTNQIWLVYRKSDRHSPRIQSLLTLNQSIPLNPPS
jgi:DNA-binding transcriptional LysR family regulator